MEQTSSLTLQPLSYKFTEIRRTSLNIEPRESFIQRFSMDPGSPTLRKVVSCDVGVIQRDNRILQEIERVFTTLDLDANGVISREELEKALDNMEITDCEAAIEKLWSTIKLDEKDGISRKEFERFVISIHKDKTNDSIQSTISSFLEPPLVKIQNNLRSMIESLEVDERPDTDLLEKARTCLDDVQTLNRGGSSIYDTDLKQELEFERQISGLPGAENITGWMTNYSMALQRMSSQQNYTLAKKRRSESKKRASLDAGDIHSETRKSFQFVTSEVEVLHEMTHCLDQDYDIFSTCKKLGREKAFMAIACHVARDHSLFEELNIDVDVYYNFMDLVRTSKSYCFV
mmetsp:Transcript_26424/g.30321  ORF Transcript_26424/g.30321 Transcript_26424/m.30321 type:complete len:345 (+) Transcript_26424:403-1437(+)